MVDPLTTGAIVTAVSKLAIDILQDSAKEGGKGILSWGSKKLTVGVRQQIAQASHKYVTAYQERHGILKVLGMSKPVSLDSVYTTVRLLDRDANPFASIADLEAAFRQEREQRLRQRKRSAKRSEISIVNAEPYLMVLGAPGAGKSTFLRKMGLEALKSKRKKFQHHCIPVFIELKRLSGQIDLQQEIIKEFETCGFPDAKGFISKALAQGRLLILLDGLDEVPTDSLNKAIEAIQDFVDRHSKNRYIASCRVAAYRSNFRRFRDVAIAEFDDQQIQQYIRNWFQSPEDVANQTATKCWDSLRQPENAAAKELAHTPLLLTFLCLVYDHAQNFPRNRSVLYGKALHILLEEWAAFNRLTNQRRIYEGLSVELEEILLADIAARAFAKDQLFFSQSELVQRIRSFLASNLNAPNHLDGKAVLDAIAVQQGILVERAEDTYSFSHLTLQEYLTAQFIANNPQFIKRLITRSLTDRRWREVFLLIAGLMKGGKGADPLLLCMEKQAQTYVSTPKLKALLQWAEQATAESAGNYKPAAKRTAAICLDRARAHTLTSRDAYALARALALDLDNLDNIEDALALVHDRDRARILALASAHDRDHTRARTLDLNIDINRAFALARALDLDLDLALASALDRDRDIDLARKFEEIKIFKSVSFTQLVANLEALKLRAPDNDQPNAIRQAFADRISQIWFQALGLDPEITKLSDDEITAINNYLYANELIVRCQEAAVRVSPQVWAGIEARMLTVQLS